MKVHLALPVAIALGVLVGVSAAFGWAKVTPAAEGFFTFCGVVIGAGLAVRYRR
jgi:hypothetical protein